MIGRDGNADQRWRSRRDDRKEKMAKSGDVLGRKKKPKLECVV